MPLRHPPLRQGVTLLETLVVIGLIGILMAMLLPAIQSVRGRVARTQCTNHLRQLGLALHQFHDANGRVPPLPPQGASGEPGALLYGVSWLAFITPFVEREALWKQCLDAYAIDPVPFHDPPHAPVRALVVTFTCPSDGRLSRPHTGSDGRTGAFTSYLGVEGGFSAEFNGVLSSYPGARFTDVTDGLGNTLMAGERPPPANLSAGWWYTAKPGATGRDYLLPAEAAIDLSLPPYCGGNAVFRPGRLDNICDVRHFWSLHEGGANFVFADASVRFLRYSTDAKLLRALATRNGGELVPGFD